MELLTFGLRLQREKDDALWKKTEDLQEEVMS